SPEEGETKPLAHRISVDFPAPLRPNTTTNSPSATSRETCDRARGAPWAYRLLTSTNSSISDHLCPEVRTHIIQKPDQDHDQQHIHRHRSILKGFKVEIQHIPDPSGPDRPEQEGGTDPDFKTVKRMGEDVGKDLGHDPVKSNQN